MGGVHIQRITLYWRVASTFFGVINMQAVFQPKSPICFFGSFFEDLERRHYENPVIRDISDIVQNHASNHFEPYIVYCSNETFQQRTLQKLL